MARPRPGAGRLAGVPAGSLPQRQASARGPRGVVLPERAHLVRGRRVTLLDTRFTPPPAARIGRRCLVWLALPPAPPGVGIADIIAHLAPRGFPLTADGVQEALCELRRGNCLRWNGVGQRRWYWRGPVEPRAPHRGTRRA